MIMVGVAVYTKTNYPIHRVWFMTIFENLETMKRKQVMLGSILNATRSD